MKIKGMWFRVLGLLALLAMITACGAANTGSSPAASASSSASTASATPAASASSAAPSASSSTPTSPSASASPSSSADESAPASTSTTGAAGETGTINIGSKNFTEQFLLAEMYAQVLEANGFEVNRDGVGLENETIAHQALLGGDIDLYPEYVATALQAILDQDLPSPPDRQQIYDAVEAGYAQLDPPVAVLEPSGFENNQALAMRSDQATELGITTYTDLSTRTGDLVVGAPPEFFERPDGLRGLQETYGGFEFQENRQLTSALRYPELEAGNVDVIVAYTTDGQLSDDQFVVLEDDQQLYPPYQVAPVVRQDVLDQYPQIADLLNSVTAALSDNETMAALNYAVDGPEGREEADVAREFLQQQGLVE